MSKTCTKCKITKSYTEFHKDKYKKDGHRCLCKVCQQLAHTKRYEKDPEGQRARVRDYRKRVKETSPEKLYLSHRKTALKKIYNLTLEDYNILLLSQEGKCKICGRLPNKKLLAVDHCHSTGKIRGLLCSNCNTTLGLMNDNIEALQIMITYLKDSA